MPGGCLIFSPTNLLRELVRLPPRFPILLAVGWHLVSACNFRYICALFRPVFQHLVLSERSFPSVSIHLHCLAWLASCTCYLVPSSRIRLLATSVAAPLHPALSLAYRLMLLMVAPLEYPMSVSSHLCLGLPLLLAPFILPSITSSSIPPALTTCPK